MKGTLYMNPRHEYFNISVSVRAYLYNQHARMYALINASKLLFIYFYPLDRKTNVVLC